MAIFLKELSLRPYLRSEPRISIPDASCSCRQKLRAFAAPHKSNVSQHSNVLQRVDFVQRFGLAAVRGFPAFPRLVPPERADYQAQAAMIALFRQLLGKSVRPAVPPGARVYAIGDIHGRLDLFEALTGAIETDDAARGPAETTVILLGDLIDRGADSAGVLAAARAWQTRRRVRILAGNHEETFLESFANAEVMRRFLRFGGRETLLSYPVDRAACSAADAEQAQALARAAVPESDLDFIRGFEDRIVIGDYLFVHAGIRPGVALGEQELSDLRWIRGPFTQSRADHGLLVVHGHTIFDEPDLRANRIGIDTGAYYSGRLTALRLEGEAQALLETHETEHGIAVQMRSIP